MTIDYTDPFPDSYEDENGEDESIEKNMDYDCFKADRNICGTGTTFVLSSVLVLLGLMLHWSIGRTLVI